MATKAITQAEQEVVRFLADRPSLEEIIAFHPSPEANERFYELQEIERGRELAEDEEEELDSYLYLEHLMRLLKAEAHGRSGR